MGPCAKDYTHHTNTSFFFSNHVCLWEWNPSRLYLSIYFLHSSHFNVCDEAARLASDGSSEPGVAAQLHGHGAWPGYKHRRQPKLQGWVQPDITICACNFLLPRLDLRCEPGSLSHHSQAYQLHTRQLNHFSLYLNYVSQFTIIHNDVFCFAINFEWCQ